MKDYYISKRCKNCGNTDYLALTKTDAAFGKHNYNVEILCSACNSNVFDLIHVERPEIDTELLDIWGYDENLHFYEQDEEIILADISHLELFLDAIDDSAYLPAKKDILLSALCIVYYNYAANSHEYTDKENAGRKIIANRVLPELVKRKDLIKSIPEWQLWDYVTDIIYTVTGLSMK